MLECVSGPWHHHRLALSLVSLMEELVLLLSHLRTGHEALPCPAVVALSPDGSRENNVCCALR